MTDINVKIRQMELNVASIKLHFEKAITDKAVPLEVRWELFVNAPRYLKNTPYNMCSEWDEYFGKDYVMYDGQYHVERHSFVVAADVIENAEENRAYYEDFPEENDGPWSFFNIEEAKEKVLAANLYGAKYDW